jgi:hypothetical protein
MKIVGVQSRTDLGMFERGGRGPQVPKSPNAQVTKCP